MAIRTGVDVASISRVRRILADHGTHFKERFFPRHVEKFGYDTLNRPETYAGMWAAKEAVFKVLGRGYRWRSVFIDHAPSGRPVVTIDPDSRGYVDTPIATDAEWDCSITHDEDMAIAVAVCLW